MPDPFTDEDRDWLKQTAQLMEAVAALEAADELARVVEQAAGEFHLMNSAMAAEDWASAERHLDAFANLGLNDPRPLLDAYRSARASKDAG